MKPIKLSLLAGVSAVAGLTMGVGLARADHPPIQLYTFEEVAQQFNGTNKMAVQINPANNQGMPYSPKQTCTGSGNLSCHTDGNTKGLKSYSDLAGHAFHATLGHNEWMDNSDSALFVVNGIQTGLNPQKPWLQSHGHNGKW